LEKKEKEKEKARKKKAIFARAISKKGDVEV
jgi:hypothetical protein